MWHYHSPAPTGSLTPKWFLNVNAHPSPLEPATLERNTWATPDVQHQPASSEVGLWQGCLSVISKNPLPSNRSIWGLLGAQFSLQEKQQPDFSVWWAPWRGTCPLSLTGNSPAFCRGFLITTQQQPNLAGVTERQPPVEPQHGSVPILVLPGTIINLTLKRGLWVGGPICYFSWA